MPLQGIIDLGSNSVRLVIYDVKHRGGKRDEKRQQAPVQNKLFRNIMNEKKIAGLSAYVEDGVFTRAGIDRAVEVLEGHLRAARNVGCNDVSIFATAVLRNCTNSEAAVKRIEKAVDTKIDLLSAEEEAHLGFVGASYDNPIETGTLIDIGGGSTELTAIYKDKDSLNISIPQGSVSSYAHYVDMILPMPPEVLAIKAAFENKLSHIDISAYRTERLYGIGGSIRALAKLYTAAFANNNRPRTLEPYQIDALSNLLATQPSTFAHAATRATPDRLHSIVPGMVIAQTLIAATGAQSLTVCKYGIREGYLLERVLEVV